jgi:hypothetical protein
MRRATHIALDILSAQVVTSGSNYSDSDVATEVALVRNHSYISYVSGKEERGPIWLSVVDQSRWQ